MIPDSIKLLGVFEPSKYSYACINQEFSELMDNFGTSEYITVVSPLEHKYDPKKFQKQRTAYLGGLIWHRDGADFIAGKEVLDDAPKYIAIWSNTNTTWIKDDATGMLFIPPKNSVVLINNFQCHHRRPDGITQDDNRWFARAYDLRK